jgi:2-succinyl-5-enolpyruvyl-6-hydroxy-3-cyclohexene-1-carboxylate synthase
MTEKETEAIDAFCATNDAVVFCDHTSGYKGKYRLLFSLVAGQRFINLTEYRPDLTIHIGEITGDYYSIRMVGRQVWRVNPDGAIRDTFRKLRYVFEMPETKFFEHYAQNSATPRDIYLKKCTELWENGFKGMPEVPFSNIWIASRMAHRIPDGSVIHFGILNSLRSWNFFELPVTVESASNVGGFGIDGGVSVLLGASLANKGKLFFGIIGDLATFYDLNALGNRHVANNLRILLVNNGKGTEFRNFGHHAARLGESADKFVAAAGHFGNKSKTLIKNFVEALGFEYLSASNKDEFDAVYEQFLNPEITDRPMMFEVFTGSQEESDALEQILSIEKDSVKLVKSKAKEFAKQALGDKRLKVFKKSLLKKH